LKDLVSPTLAAETPTPEAAAEAEAGADSDVDGHVTVAGGIAAVVLAGVSAEMLEGPPLLGLGETTTTTAPAPAAAGQAPAKGVSSVAAAVAELLQPISGNPNSSSKVTFLTSRRYGSKYSSRRSSSSKARSVPSPEQLRVHQSAVDAIPAYPYFGRVWDKWNKMKLASPAGSPQKGQGVVQPSQAAASTIADSAGLADSAAVADAAAAADSAVPEMWSIQLADSALADSAVVAEMWSRQQAQAAAATAAAVEAAALDLGMLAASAVGAADSPAAATAGVDRFVSAGGASDCEAGKQLAAWPLELGSEFEYDAAVSFEAQPLT
jgi:hypothetical protein